MDHRVIQLDAIATTRTNCIQNHGSVVRRFKYSIWEEESYSRVFSLICPSSIR